MLNSRLLTIIATALFGGFIIYLDVFGGQDDFVKQNQEFMRRLVLGFLGIALFLQLLRLAAEWSEKPNSMAGSTIVELLLSVGRIVEQKVWRFRSVAATFSGNQAFQKLTQPELQIGLILKEVNDYLRSQHKMREDRLDATVLHKNGEKWDYLFNSNPNRNRTSANTLMTEQSTARHAHSNGRPVFFASKVAASKTKNYRLGLEESTDGSIYCYPVKVETKSGEKQFVITFATYGGCLCEKYNIQAERALSLIFREFSRRIELELVLWTIKGFKKEPRSAKVKIDPRRQKK